MEDTATNGNLKDDTHNERHLAIVELVQKFKFIGNFTVLTTKVNWTIHYQIIGSRPFMINHLILSMYTFRTFVLDSW